MDKQKVDRNSYNFLSKQLIRHQEEGRVSSEQVAGILDTYEIKEKVNFIQVLVIVGSILIGLGILSFIASNWIYLSKLSKFLLIIGFYLLTTITAYLLSEKYPKTGRSLIYLGILIFGAGIFLVGQMFHFAGNFTSASLLWALGILPMVVVFRDKLIFVFIHVLLLVYLNGLYIYDEFPFILILFIPLLFLGQKLVSERRIMFLTNLLTLNFVWYILDKSLSLEVELVVLIFFIIGLIFYFVKIPVYSSIFKLQGNLIFSFTGFLLTFEFFWEDILFLKTDIPIHLLFSIGFLIFLLFLVRKENLISLVLIGLIIIRYYFDAMYDFLPKSIFFLIGGAILLGFGYYFERKRRKLKGEN